MHEESARLFIGSVATHFTASLSGDNPPRLVFHFTSPVNPTVATEPGALRMTFSREPASRPGLADSHLREQGDSVCHLQREQWRCGRHGECLYPGDGQFQQRWTHDDYRSHAGRRAELPTPPASRNGIGTRTARSDRDDSHRCPNTGASSRAAILQ